MKMVREPHTHAVLAGITALALVLAACGSKDDNNGTSAPPANTETAGGPTSSAAESSAGTTGANLNACFVLDIGGVDDKSFNEGSYGGAKAAQAKNPNLKISYVPSNSGNDYTPNLKAQVNKGCDPVVGVGGLMFDNVSTIAKANPDTHFAEVDAGSAGPNFFGMVFNTAQGGFLAGYLAAGMTKTGKVATWGGLAIPPVTIYMDGFWEGVQYYNKQKGKDVQVLGWDEKDQKGGTFSQSFTDQNKGKQISQTFVQQGADIIFPVAGGAGLGAATAAQASNGAVSVIWVDIDGCKSVAQYCKYFLTTVLKNLSGAVEEYLNEAGTGTFPTGNYVGTLDNDGTGLAPFHDYDAKVPDELKGELDDIKAGIIDGSIKITSPSQPTDS